MNWNKSEWRLLNDGQKEILEKLNTVKHDFSLLSSDVASIKNSLLEHKRDVDKLEGQVEILNKESAANRSGLNAIKSLGGIVFAVTLAISGWYFSSINNNLKSATELSNSNRQQIETNEQKYQIQFQALQTLTNQNAQAHEELSKRLTALREEQLRNYRK
jgi:uncharacterized protein HemX